MPIKAFFTELGLRKGVFFQVIVLLLNTFTWWYIALGIIITLINGLEATYVESVGLWTAFYVAMTVSSIAGSFLASRFDRFRLIYCWMILGVFVSLLPALIGDISTLAVLSTCLLWGMSFGLGMPSCLAYFSECSSLENRGRMGGIVFFFANLSTPLFFMLFFGVLNLTVSFLFLALWRGVGLVAFFLLASERPAPSEERRRASLKSVFGDRNFVLYWIAWVMFCFIDYLEEPILKNTFGGGVFRWINLTEPIIACVSALVGGLLCDRIGRKKMVIYGFVAMGVTYAFIGLFPRTPVSWYFYCIVDGVAWGLFMVTFILTLWGDLAKPGLREVYYMIGSIPFFLVDLVRIISAPYILLIPEYAAFSLASFFLFIAVLPLMYAPETLPERKIELRRLRKYVEKAREVKEKYEKG